MKAVIFNGSMNNNLESVGKRLSDYIEHQLQLSEVDVDIFTMSTAGIPLLNIQDMKDPPDSVLAMCDSFQKADLHFWLAPLYHGSIPGLMKNCLDWLEIRSNTSSPYLTGKTVGMICWADGAKAVNGINTMTTIAHALRAWALPYNVPISTRMLNQAGRNGISEYYQQKLNLLIDLGLSR